MEHDTRIEIFINGELVSIHEFNLSNACIDNVVDIQSEDFYKSLIT